MGQGTPTPAEIGEELIQLISETSETTGLSVSAIASVIVHTTGIKFKIQDGKLNITEAALLAMDNKMVYARAKCRALELPHRTIPEPTIQMTTRPVAPRPVAKAEALPQRREEFKFSLSGDIPGGGIFLVCFAIGVVILLGWVFAHAPGSPGYVPKPMTAEDKFIRDAVTLDRMIHQGEKERAEKLAKEYERQEREGR